ncbi:MAG: tripartite tricarboxylate transporter TctB family protein, partial [Rhodospirillales bacterium]
MVTGFNNSPGTSFDGRAFVELALWLTLAGGAWYLSGDFAGPLPGYEPGAAAWPRFIILLLAAVAILQFLSKFRKAGTPAVVDEAADPLRFRGAGLQIAATFLAPLAYGWLLPRVGHFIATPIFLIAFALILGERRIRLVLLTSAFVFAVVLGIFSALFYVPLPDGSWPFFADISHQIMSWLR